MLNLIPAVLASSYLTSSGNAQAARHETAGRLKMLKLRTERIASTTGGLLERMHAAQLGGGGAGQTSAVGEEGGGAPSEAQEAEQGQGLQVHVQEEHRRAVVKAQGLVA